jgi:Holliday junction resolvasome RuvABC DNA-binding subunit
VGTGCLLVPAVYRLAQIAVPSGGAPEPVVAGERLRDDLLSALQNLGYHRAMAEKAIDASRSSTDAPSFEQALKAALRELMR